MSGATLGDIRVVLDAVTASFQRGMAGAAQATTAVGSAATSAAHALRSAGEAIDRFEKSAKRAGVSVDGLADAAKTVGLAGLAAGAGILAAVDAAADAEKRQRALSVAFGDGANAFRAFAGELSTSTGSSAREIEGLSSSIQLMLTNLLGSRGAAQQATQALASLAVDAASVFPVSTAEAFEAFAAALRGENDPIEKLGVSLKEATLAAKAAELGFSGAFAKLSTSQQTAARLAAIQEQLAQVTGKAAEAQDSLSASLARASDGFSGLLEGIGTVIAQQDAFKGFIGVVNQGLQDMVGSLDAIAKARGFEEAGNIAGAVGDKLRRIREEIAKTTNELAGFNFKRLNGGLTGQDIQVVETLLARLETLKKRQAEIVGQQRKTTSSDGTKKSVFDPDAAKHAQKAAEAAASLLADLRAASEIDFPEIAKIVSNLEKARLEQTKLRAEGVATDPTLPPQVAAAQLGRLIATADQDSLAETIVAVRRAADSLGISFAEIARQVPAVLDALPNPRGRIGNPFLADDSISQIAAQTGRRLAGLSDKVEAATSAYDQGHEPLLQFTRDFPEVAAAATAGFGDVTSALKGDLSGLTRAVGGALGQQVETQFDARFAGIGAEVGASFAAAGLGVAAALAAVGEIILAPVLAFAGRFTEADNRVGAIASDTGQSALAGGLAGLFAASGFGPFSIAVAPVTAALGAMQGAALAAAQQTEAFGKVQEAVGFIVDEVVGHFEPLGQKMFAFVGILDELGAAFAPLFDILAGDGLVRVLFDVTKAAAESLLFFAGVANEISLGLVSVSRALNPNDPGLAQTEAGLLLLRNSLKEAAADIDSLGFDDAARQGAKNAALEEAHRKAQDAADAARKAADDAAAKAATDLSSALFNATRDFKVEGYRFRSQDALSPASPIGPLSTGPVVSTPAVGGTQLIVEGDVVVQTSDPDRFFRELEKRARKKSVAATGSPLGG